MTNQPITATLTFGNQIAASILNWEEYHFMSDFLEPCSAFTMIASESNESHTLRDLLLTFGAGARSLPNTFTCGMPVTLTLKYTVPTDLPNQSYSLMVGYVEQVEVQTSREGTLYTLRGRNLLAPLCDSGIDPISSTYKFAEGQSLADVVGKVFLSFGIKSVWLTDAKNRLVSTGNDPFSTIVKEKTIQVEVGESFDDQGNVIPSSVTTQQFFQYIDPTNNYDLSEKNIKKLQPKEEQTFMEFVEEHLARFHLHCWAMADGSGIVIGKPDYADSNLGQSIVNRLDGRGNNVIHGNIHIDYFSQPSVIIIAGKQGGGDNPHVRVRVARVNEFLGYDSQNNVIPSVNKLIKNFKGLVPVPIGFVGKQIVKNYSQYFTVPTVARAVYIEQKDTSTQDELIAFADRKMAEFQKKALVLRYIVQDHVADNGIPWKHNTLVTVNDENLKVHGVFWVQTVAFHKDRHSGTTTELTLIPLGTIQL